MSYEPTVWNVGDTIAVAKLNKLEQGVAEMSSGYTPTVWVDGDEITAQKMNRLEQAVAESGGGGGGSSDFSTAEVTVVNNAVNSSPYLTKDTPSIKGDPSLGISAGIVFAPMETVAVGGTSTFTVPLYKGVCAWSAKPFTDAGSVSLSGDITDVYGQAYIITGDCTITIS